MSVQTPCSLTDRRVQPSKWYTPSSTLRPNEEHREENAEVPRPVSGILCQMHKRTVQGALRHRTFRYENYSEGKYGMWTLGQNRHVRAIIWLLGFCRSRGQHKLCPHGRSASRLHHQAWGYQKDPDGHAEHGTLSSRLGFCHAPRWILGPLSFSTSGQTV